MARMRRARAEERGVCAIAMAMGHVQANRIEFGFGMGAAAVYLTNGTDVATTLSTSGNGSAVVSSGSVSFRNAPITLVANLVVGRAASSSGAQAGSSSDSNSHDPHWTSDAVSNYLRDNLVLQRINLATIRPSNKEYGAELEDGQYVGRSLMMPSRGAAIDGDH